MTAAERILADLRTHGVTVELRDGRLHFQAPAPPPEDFVQRALAHRLDLARLLVVEAAERIFTDPVTGAPPWVVTCRRCGGSTWWSRPGGPPVCNTSHLRPDSHKSCVNRQEARRDRPGGAV